MSDMNRAIEPKSDQLNSDDLLSGPRTIKITRVVVSGGPEQPVSIFFAGDNGKPYKPCKSMSRVMVQVWGPDSSKYAGNSMTLYRDPDVKWGGMAIGGIRISHISGIDKPLTVSLTASKGKWKPFTVNPLKPDQEPKKAPATVGEVLDGLPQEDEVKSGWDAWCRSAKSQIGLCREIDALNDWLADNDEKRNDLMLYNEKTALWLAGIIEAKKLSLSQ